MSKETVAKRISERMAELGISRQAELVRRTGGRIDPSQMSKYIRGETLPRADALEVLADALSCSTDFLVGRSDMAHNMEGGLKAVVAGSASFGSLPILGFAHAGHTDEHDPLHGEIFDLMSMVNDGAFAVRIRGDSMEGPSPDSLRDGDLVVLEPTSERPSSGEIWLVRYLASGEQRIRRVLVRGDSSMLLVPDNPTWESEAVSGENVVPVARAVLRISVDRASRVVSTMEEYIRVVDPEVRDVLADRAVHDGLKDADLRNALATCLADDDLRRLMSVSAQMPEHVRKALRTIAEQMVTTDT